MLGNVSFRSKETPKNCNRLKRSKELSLRLFLPPGSLLFHIRCKQMGLCFEFASIIDQKLRGVVESIDETHGFGIETVRRLSVSWTVRRILPWMKTPIVSR